MGRAVFVLAMLVPGLAVAGPQEDAEAEQEADLVALGAAFDAHFAQDDVAQVIALAKKVEFETIDVPYATEWEALEQLTNHKLTATIPASDARCRGAALAALIMRRRQELRVGWVGGFTFEIACEASSITGFWNSWNALPHGGMVSMTQIDAAGDDVGLGHWEMRLEWKPLPPDPDDASQWFQAVQWPIGQILAAVTRLRNAITRGEGELVRGLVKNLAEYALKDVEGYPAFPDDDTLLAAEITWLTEVIADLDHGDLQKVVARADPGVPKKTSKKKSYKKKTKAIEKRWKKAYAKRLARFRAVSEAFREAHDL